MRTYKAPALVQADKPLQYDMVDQPPFDGLWADRRHTFQTIPGEPQTSLNARPSNIPRNAQLSYPAGTSRLRSSYVELDDFSDSEDDSDSESEVGSFPWATLQTRRSRHRERRAEEVADQSETIIQLLILVNFALILYIVFRTHT